jgi:Tol biopolymer transport system component
VIGATAASCTDDDSAPAITTVTRATESTPPPLATPTVAPSSTSPSPTTPTSTSSPPTTSTRLRVEGHGESPVSVGEPIDLADLRGRIVFDDYEDVYTMRPDGGDVRNVTTAAGSEFDGSASPDGDFVVYRDSRRGINEDDEVYIARADGTEARNLTNNPANDWGPDWSADGEWIVFNSDREGAMRSYLVRPDGTDLVLVPTDVWAEYPTLSPDGSTVAFMSHTGADYDIYVADVATGEATRLTEASGSDGWPAWSPDGTTIAFASERDDCTRVPADQDCWSSGEPGEHHDIWIMNADGSNQRRVTPEIGQFVTWSPDGRYLLISGHALFVVRPDGTGRLELRAEGFPLALGGIPDWSS